MWEEADVLIYIINSHCLTKYCIDDAKMES